MPPNESNVSLWQTPGGSNADALATPKLDSVFARAVPAPGPTPTPDYARQLDDTPTNTWQPDRSAAPAGAERLAISDTWPLVATGSPADRQGMGAASTAENSPQIVSDIPADNHWRPGARYAQSGTPPRPLRPPRPPPNPTQGPSVPLKVPLRIRDEWVWELRLGQANRLFEAQTRAEKSIARVREIDPKWRPQPSAYESVEGLMLVT